jgi:hypothetical protein
LELRGRNRRVEYNEKLLHNLYFSPHVRVIRSRRRERMVNIAHMGGQNNESKGPLGRP